MSRKINIRPTTAVYSTYKNIKYFPWTAISEFVDNSTQSYFDNKEKLCATKYWNGLEIEINHGESELGTYLEIKDNAYGMNYNDFQRAIVLDSPPKTASRSEFGMGLKTAACWFGLIWSVESTELGSGIKYKTTVDVEQLHQYKNEEIEVEEENCNPKDHGTTIKIWHMNRTIKGRSAGKTKEQLQGIYRNDLRKGEIKIYYNDELLQFSEVPVLTEKMPSGEIVTWKKDVEFVVGNGEEIYHVNGFIGLRDKAKVADSGFTLLRNGRAIIGGYENNYRPPEVFGASNTFPYQRMFGELNLDDWPVTQTKDSFDWYNGLEDNFIEKLCDITADYKKKANELRKRKKKNVDEDLDNLTASFKEAGIITNVTSEAISEEEVNKLSKLFAKHVDQTHNEDLVRESILVDSDGNEVPFVGRKMSFEMDNDIIDLKLIIDNNNIGNDWLSIKKEDKDYIIDWNINHPFFEPIIDNKMYVDMMSKFIFALALSEIDSIRINVDGKVPASLIRKNMNDILKKIIYTEIVDYDDEQDD